MTKKEQQIEIARFCGWEVCSFGGRYNGANYLCPKGFQEAAMFDDEIPGLKFLEFETKFPSHAHIKAPNYTEDLNAMHEAAIVLKKRDEIAYSAYCIRLLMEVIPSDPIDATSEQRAEAFCRTLWPERWDK